MNAVVATFTLWIPRQQMCECRPSTPEILLSNLQFKQWINNLIDKQELTAKIFRRHLNKIIQTDKYLGSFSISLLDWNGIRHHGLSPTAYQRILG